MISFAHRPSSKSLQQIHAAPFLQSSDCDNFRFYYMSHWSPMIEVDICPNQDQHAHQCDQPVSSIQHFNLSGEIVNVWTHNGCMATTPYLSESAPAIKGMRAIPVTPMLTIQPMAPDRRYPGTRLPHWFKINGKIGPRKSPTMQIAIADEMKWGSVQTRICKLMILAYQRILSC